MTPAEVELAKSSYARAYAERSANIATTHALALRTARSRAAQALTSLGVEERRAYHRQRGEIYAQESQIRALVANSIRKGGTRKTAGIEELLGCSALACRLHIESQFEDGMTWAGAGRRLWHIDHIRPIASFDKTDSDWVFKANHYTNLQPLWAQDNLRKGAKWGLDKHP